MTYPPSHLGLPPDEATALSAVRNLKDVAVNGRNLRVESSTDEPGPRRGRGGVEVGGRIGPGGRFRDDSPPPPQRAPLPPAREEIPASGRVDIQLLPPGQDLPGQKATDAISKTLAAISPGQMQDVMAGMKVGESGFTLRTHERNRSRFHRSIARRRHAMGRDGAEGFCADAHRDAT